MKVVNCDALMEQVVDYHNKQGMLLTTSKLMEMLDTAPKLDVIPMTLVADILTEMFADKCACNFCSNDEWLPYICDFCQTDNGCELGEGQNENCWLQFIKHYHKKDKILKENEQAKSWLDNI